MKYIACVFLFAATGMAQNLVSPVEGHDANLIRVAATTAYVPMTASERWQQYMHGNFTGQGVLLRALKTATFEEMAHHPKEWGTDGAGFSQRFGSTLARNTAQGSITDGLAALLGHDTRYMVCKTCEGRRARAKYALEMVFLTRNEEGRKVFDISKFAGMSGAALLATTWQPHESSPPVLVSARFTALGIGTSAMTNLAREFTPEIKKMLHRNQ